MIRWLEMTKRNGSMTDKTPATEAANRLGSRMWAWNRDTSYDEISGTVANIWRDLAAIEAEAREQGRAEGDEYKEATDAAMNYGQGRADALREAAERVRALESDTQIVGFVDMKSAVLAILTEQEPHQTCRCVTKDGVRQPTFECPIHTPFTEQER
jgi:hypothetical protein